MDALAEPARGCPECETRKAEAPAIEAKLIELLARHAAGDETERKSQIRAVVHEELSVLAERVDSRRSRNSSSHASEAVARSMRWSLDEASHVH
jgi:hypothetical protein